jgi:hypothetical protein
MIDVFELITDPDLMQSYTVLRSSGRFTVGGWQENTPEQISMQGVVLPTTSKDLEQLPEGDRVTESMTFYSTDPLFVTHNDSNAGTSDQIQFNGSLYRLARVKNYSKYGYWKAIGVRMSGD